MLKGGVKVVFGMRCIVSTLGEGGLGVLPQKKIIKKAYNYAKQLHPIYSSSNYFVHVSQTNNIHIDQFSKEHKHTRMYKYS